MFEMTYEDESWTGTYSIEDITYTADGKEYSLNFKKCGIEGKFAVNQICETDPDAVVEGKRQRKIQTLVTQIYPSQQSHRMEPYMRKTALRM